MTTQELIDKARADGKWLYTYYQEIWFSPDELEQAQKEGRFCWGSCNFQVRDPEEAIAEVRRGEVAARAQVTRLEARIEQSKQSQKMLGVKG